MYFTMPKRHFDLERLSDTFEDPTEPISVLERAAIALRHAKTDCDVRVFIVITLATGERYVVRDIEKVERFISPNSYHLRVKFKPIKALADCDVIRWVNYDCISTPMSVTNRRLCMEAGDYIDFKHEETI
jgi:hypothetical protein